MAVPNLSTLDSRGLSDRLRTLAGDERNVQADFLLHLAELDRRRSFAELGYPSLWEYCLRALHLREGAAGRRIGAMRVLRRFPQLEAALRDGRLSLSTLCALGPVLTDDNVQALAARAAFKTAAEVDEIVAAVKPKPAPADGVRRMPVPAAVVTNLAPATAGASPVRVSGSAPPPVLDPIAPVAAATGPLLVPAAANDLPALSTGPTSRTVGQDSRSSELRATSADRWSLRVTLDAEGKRDLDTLVALLGHKVPDRDLATVVKQALRCAVQEQGKRKGAAAPAKPHRPAAAAALGQSSHVAAAVRREVWTRDGGQCTFVAPDGTRCAARSRLEFDHVVPRALGGGSNVDNVRIRCRTHNLLHAEQAFGAELMSRFRKATST
jgi:hypothetical protein